MKKLYTLLFVALTSVSFGQLLNETFSYPDATILQTQSGYTALNSGDDLLISNESLNYTGLLSSTGNKLVFGAAGIDASRDLSTSQTTGTTYGSLLINVTDLTLNSAPSTTGGYQFGFISTGTNFGATLWIKRIDADTYSVGINSRTTAANTVYASTILNVNQTYLIVLSYTLNPAASDDVVKLWINPTGLGEATPPAENATMTNTGGTDLASISKILIRQGSITDTPELQLDEIRVGTTWAEVTPPTTASLADNNINGLSMYPNPLYGNTLFLTSTANAGMSVQIFDLLGKEVTKANVINNTINVANLQTGVYVVKIIEEDKTATKKLVIQ